MRDITEFLKDMVNIDAQIAANCKEEIKLGRPPKGDTAAPGKTRQADYERKIRERRQRNIAVLDMETDPFDKKLQTSVHPFLAVLYSDEFETLVIWEQDHAKLCQRVVDAIERLPDRFTIYAHNGGRFDFLFFVSKLRGEVKFKGRGIMSARIGNHELRDSFHIIPERLAAYQKDHFDYQRMHKDNRDGWRKEIIEYCIADCRYLLDIVKDFVAKYGFKLSIGQAAMAVLKSFYTVKKINQGFDKQLRQFYFGGRVECLAGRGHFTGDYKLYDENSEYPYAMSSRQHPVGDFFDYDMRRGVPNDDTVFLSVTCDNNRALIGRGANGETTSEISRGTFLTTIWEFNVAYQYDLIRNIEINYCLDCKLRTDFSRFINPLYENRLKTKTELGLLKSQGLENTARFIDVKRDDIFYKLLLNNSYGKFAQNPENYKEHYITDPGAVPAPEWMKSIQELDDEERIKYAMPLFDSEAYRVWHKPSPGFRYNNVGTAASITGAARADLLDAIQRAIDPIYCDTDSIICRELPGVEMSKTRLGAWDLEDEFSQVIIDGKKLYAVWHKEPKRRSPEELANHIDPRYTVKSKGGSGFTWQNMLDMLHGDKIVMVNKAPTLTKFSTQNYITRTFQATAKLRA